MEIEVSHIAFQVEKQTQDKGVDVYKLVVKALVPKDETIERKEIQRVEQLVETTNIDEQGKPIFDKKIVANEITVREVVKINKPTDFGTFTVYGNFTDRDYKTMARAYVASSDKLDKLKQQVYGND